MTARNAPAHNGPAPFAPLVPRERRVVLAALLGVSALAWAYLLGMALATPALEREGAMHAASWNAAYFAAMLTMWIVMMAGMMLPSATPAILLYAAIARRRRAAAAVYRNTASFAAGYLVVWSAFSVAAALAQWWLSESALLSPMMTSTSRIFSGVLFLAAAVYQLTPLKRACLAHCRAPVEFLAGRRRSGRFAALQLGAEHGLYCLGCCWVLMALLFAFGVMNLLWLAAVAIFVLAEKAFPAGERIARIGGALMAGTGTWLLLIA